VREESWGSAFSDEFLSHTPLCENKEKARGRREKDKWQALHPGGGGAGRGPRVLELFLGLVPETTIKKGAKTKIPGKVGVLKAKQPI